MKKPANYNSTFNQAAFEAARNLLSRLKLGEKDAIESSVQFLERDDYLFGTGYVKEKMWRRLRYVVLSETHKARLRQVALLYVRTRWSSEFFAMCRFINLIGCNDNLRDQLAELQQSPEAVAHNRANLLLEYCESVERGEAMRWALNNNFRAVQEEKRQERRQLRKRPRI